MPTAWTARAKPIFSSRAVISAAPKVAATDVVWNPRK
jgi:hypothetical protein